MSVRPSPYFRDPALAQVAGNLAALFGSPDPQDIAAMKVADATVAAKLAEARRQDGLTEAEKAAAGRLSEFYNQSTDPKVDWGTIDRYGVGAGAFHPNQTMTSVDRNNATQRYGYDTSAATSRANNAADNARAIQERQIQEAAARDRMGIVDATEIGKARLGGLADLYAPVGRDAIRPEVPAAIASQFGMPQALPAVAGVRSPLSETEATGQFMLGLSPEEQRAIGLSQGAVKIGAGERAVMPDRSVIEGARKPLSASEWEAEQKERLRQSGSLSDQLLIDSIMGEQTPVKTVGASGTPVYSSPGAAMRQGLSAYEAPNPEKLDNYLAVGPNNEEKRFLGYVGPDSRVYDANTQQPVPNVVRKESTGGGVSFETDGQGGIKLSTGNAAGNTTARTTDLQRQEADAGRAANELTAIFDNIRADDVGVAGNMNDFLTNYGAQVFPSVARSDVAGMRNQMQASSINLARALVGDERLSDADRRAANEVMVSGGLGESLPGAQAKLASLIALNAYRGKFANTVRNGGDPLPPLDRAMLGRLVDEGAITPRVAQVYAENVLSRGSQPSGGLATFSKRFGAGAPAAAAVGTATLAPGTVEDGFVFKGGDPADQANWTPVN